MKVSFEFNDNETGAQMVAAIVGLFGSSVAAAPALAAAVPVLPGAIHPHDRPDTGATVVTPPQGHPGTPTTPQVDANGLPWDARIHSDSKALTEKHVWRKRKGVDDITVAQVTAELKQRVGTTAGATPAQAAHVPQLSIVPPAAVVPALQPVAPALTPLPSLAPPQPSPFEALITFFVSHTQRSDNPTGRLTEAYIQQCLASFGVADGNVVNLQHETAERIAAIRSAFAQALGVQ